MKNLAALLLCLGALGLCPRMAAQQDSSTCTFADGKSVRVTYDQVPTSKPLDEGRAWTPGDKHMLLFSETPTQLAGSEIAIGAYSLYLIPGAKEWSLVVNRNVGDGAAYNKAQDVVRAPMQIGTLSSKENQFEVYLGRIAPRQCTMRFDYGKTRAWIELQEK